ncbi:MAG: PhoH family protein [Porphyromonas sp.]|nr:PhoH family protein [Porphyromonas sp.]
MIERIYVVEEADIELFAGPNKANLIALNNLLPRIRLRLHGNVIKILASQSESDRVIAILEQMEELCTRYNQLSEADVITLIKGKERIEEEAQLQQSGQLILYGLHGRAILAKGENQQEMCARFDNCDLTFAIGPAGSGKTFIAICLAVRALKAKQVRRIILSRPAVEAGEKLGFLPGEMKDKLDPYLQPLYDALGELIPNAKLKDYLDTGVIQIAPLAFMRGRTLNDAVVILDEAQNTSPQQMKMFLTRLGMNSKMIITGDLTQVDLPRGQRSGLRDAVERLQDVEGISMIRMNQTDIVRHPLVQRIVDVYEQSEHRQTIEE